MPLQLRFLFLICLFPTLLFSQSDVSIQLKEYHRLDSICEVMKEGDLQGIVATSKKMHAIGVALNSDTLIMKANLLQGQALDFLGVMDAALKIYYENLNLAEQSGNCFYKVKTANLIGAVHQSMQDWKTSQNYLLKARSYARACNMPDTLIINYDIGRNMFNLGDRTGGIRLVEQNLRASRDKQVQVGIMMGISSLSNLLAESGDFKRAMEVELETLQMPEEMLGNLELAQIYERLTELAIELGQFTQAQQYQNKALKYAQDLQLNDWLYESYMNQSDIDEAAGNYESALKNYEKYSALKDSVYQNEYKDKMAAMTALYELDSKQKAIDLLEKDQQIKAVKIQEQRIFILVGLLLAALLLLGLVLYNQRKTQRLKDGFAQDLIKAQEQERQRISRELHDSVGQNILFVKNRLQRLPPPPDVQLAESVDGALEEVRNIAKDLYPNQLEEQGLAAAVDALCELVKDTSGIFISSDLEGVDDKLNREAKINCYRIIQECINNAMKHAQASAIRISCNLQPDKVELVIQDNGVGFDKNILMRKSVRSFGMINMEERVKMLSGKFELETSANKGAKLTFIIPV